jgi:hypothetical protein
MTDRKKIMELSSLMKQKTTDCSALVREVLEQLIADLPHEQTGDIIWLLEQLDMMPSILYHPEEKCYLCVPVTRETISWIDWETKRLISFIIPLSTTWYTGLREALYDHIKTITYLTQQANEQRETDTGDF